MDVYFIRFGELANACGFLYLAWAINATDLAGPRSRTQVGLTDCVLLLAIAPFFVALIATFRKELTQSQWLLIRATHQALAIVTVAITGTIFLVGLPDTTPATICVGIFALLQVAALKASRQFIVDASHVRPWQVRTLRVAMVFLFAFLFLLMK